MTEPEQRTKARQAGASLVVLAAVALGGMLAFSRAFAVGAAPLAGSGSAAAIDSACSTARFLTFAVLAAAGVVRMGAQDQIASYLPVQEMLPAVGQGAIGLEVRDQDNRATQVCAAVNDAATFACVTAERRVLQALEGGCQVPLGAYARYEQGSLHFDAAVFSLDGSREARASGVWPADANADDAAAAMVAMLR